MLGNCQSVIDDGRLRRLLGRGFQLSQVVERWQARVIWVVSQAEPHYPRRLKAKLREDAPAVVKPDAPLEAASVREPSPIYNSPEHRSALGTGSVESEVALPKISDRIASDASPPPLLKPADTLFIAVREIARQVLTVPTKDVEFATALRISGPLAKTWLTRLVESRTVVADWRLTLWGQKCKVHYMQPLASRLT